MDSSAHLANKEGKNRISRRGNVETIKDERANAAVHESRGRKPAKAILDRGRERVRMREREREKEAKKDQGSDKFLPGSIAPPNKVPRHLRFKAFEK